MINLTQLLEVLKKQGATGILAMWLWYTHTEVQDLKFRLYDCYGSGKQTNPRNQINDNSSFVIIPKDELNDSL